MEGREGGGGLWKAPQHIRLAAGLESHEACCWQCVCAGPLRPPSVLTYYQRVGRLSMQGWHRHAIYAILKQKPYNFTTNTLKAYLSAQSSSLSASVISKTHRSAQKPRGRQLNAKVCGCKIAIFLILSFFVTTLCSNNDISKTVQVLTVILSQN